MAKLIEKIKDKRAPEPETPARRDIPVVHPAPEQGLTSAQVRERTDAGWTNAPVDPPGKTVKQIVLSNIFTYFNMLFFLLALCVIAVQQWLNLTFMGVIIVNTAIGIVQELRSKKTLDKLSILASPKAVAVRDGKRVTVDTAQLVRDDIVIFAAGNQIYADAVVASESCYVNEALITGESDEIKKTPGDKLLSGSFVVSGMCRAQLTDVGADSYVSRLTQEAKRAKKPQQSEMMRALQNLVKWIGVIVIPLGVVMFIKEYVWLGREVPIAVTSTVGSIIGMIPEGLYLLTSLALVAGVVRLAQRKTLVHELGCIETLARVDTLCVDKTGTVTENKMIVEDVCPLCDDRFTLDDIRMIMADYVYAMQADNDTMAALRRYFTGEKTQDATATLPFSSAKKYGGVSFHDEETYLLGAPDVLLAGRENPYQEQIEGYSAKGCRVLLLGMYDGALSDETLDAGLLPIALILLSNKIRAEAPETFGYFAAQGVAVKVISGDNARTVSEVAKRAGIENADRFVDARTLNSENPTFDNGDYDIRLTNVIVLVPGDTPRVILFNHFSWLSTPKFYGTAALNILPTYEVSAELWRLEDGPTGRILYDDGDDSFVADYHSIEMRTVTSNLFRNVAPSPSLYASFIFPNQGTRQRGYITYTIAPRALLPEGYRQAGYSQMTYMHQKKRFLYPAETADSSSIFSINGPFESMQPAPLIFELTESGIKLDQ